jgi:predicted aspartyl protease
MATLYKHLQSKGYNRVRLTPINTNHFLLKAFVNDICGVFILDTGASATCVDLEHTKYFHLHSQPSTEKASSASSVEMHTEMATNNMIRIGKWVAKNKSVVLFDMKAVNEALKLQENDPVHGIVGADVLKSGQAIIDYKNNWLYLKNKTAP